MLGASAAHASPNQYALKGKGLYCLGKYRLAIEAIADAKNDAAIRRAASAAIFSGQCIASGNDVPSLVEKVKEKRTPGGARYYCFVMPGQDEFQCSPAQSMTTVAQLQVERTGDFEVIADNDSVVTAKCLEGGRVFVEKGKQWRRTSMVFFSAAEAIQRTVPSDKNRALRVGCQGLDY